MFLMSLSFIRQDDVFIQCLSHDTRYQTSIFYEQLRIVLPRVPSDQISEQGTDCNGWTCANLHQDFQAILRHKAFNTVSLFPHCIYQTPKKVNDSVRTVVFQLNHSNTYAEYYHTHICFIYVTEKSNERNSDKKVAQSCDQSVESLICPG